MDVSVIVCVGDQLLQVIHVPNRCWTCLFQLCFFFFFIFKENVGGTTYFYSPDDFTPQHEATVSIDLGWVQGQSVWSLLSITGLGVGPGTIDLFTTVQNRTLICFWQA